MNTAFEVTVDDVENVLNKHKLELELDADTIHGELDHDALEEAALWGDDMDEQTNYACQEIEKQLKEMGYLGENVETKYPTV
jgi:hypothetical protein